MSDDTLNMLSLIGYIGLALTALVVSFRAYDAWMLKLEKERYDRDQ